VADFGTLADYELGIELHPASAAEWKRSALMLNSDALGHETATFHDGGGNVVCVHGGPDMLVTLDDLIDLAHEASQAGDRKLRDRALDALNGDEAARAECVSTVLDRRIHAAEG
jgi:hypothetical protein